MCKDNVGSNKQLLKKQSWSWFLLLSCSVKYDAGHPGLHKMDQALSSITQETNKHKMVDQFNQYIDAFENYFF